MFKRFLQLIVKNPKIHLHDNNVLLLVVHVGSKGSIIQQKNHVNRVSTLDVSDLMRSAIHLHKKFVLLLQFFLRVGGLGGGVGG